MDKPDAEALVGRTLGEFVVRERIGSGGQGLVYRAEQPALAREAVIKVLHNRTPAGPETTQRFLREARLASRLDHPYAAHVYAFGAEADGLLWIAMERVRGTPLDKMLRGGGPIPLVRLIPFLERLCEVVHSAHELGIVHRDIKPANVMVLARAGRLLPKLLDFGLAKLHETPEVVPEGPLDEFEVGADTMSPTPPREGVTGRGVVLGSPAYMSPEQWQDAGGATGRSDIYALGVLTFEALAGKVPFTGRSVMELSKAHATQRPPALPDGVPAALNEVLARALAKAPDARYPTALELAAALRHASGVTERDPLPRLADEERAAALADAPQPLADAVAALDGARNIHQARDAVWVAVRVATRVLGIVALAGRLQTRAGDAPPGAWNDELRALRRQGSGDEGWLALARALVTPLHPVAELAELVADTTLDDLFAERRFLGDAPTEEQVTQSLARTLPLLARLLRRLAPLWAYTWVVPRGELADAWMGLTRPRRPSVGVAGTELRDGEVGLIDPRGVPVVRLHPFVQAAAPAPGSPERIFLLEGPGRRGARLVAWPDGFEREDEEPWEALRTLLEDSRDESAGSAREESPFPGLAAFGRDEADRFFGREREVELFVNRLRGQPLLCVVGPSGAGKSSFVRAGVLPAVEERWESVVIRPGRAPLAALAAALGDADLSPERLRARPRPLLLVVDQLEELFTLCPDAGEREAFARVLAGAARSVDDPVRVILTLRDDFLMRAERLAALRDRLAHALFLIQTPARADLVRIVREPVRRVGYEWDDPALPEEMVDAVASEPGALALISFTAARVWEGRDRPFRRLRRRAYDALGGVGGALAQHAEQTLASLAPEERALVREAFRRLVTVDGTRAVVDRVELLEVLGARGAAVLEKLIDARLLVASEGEDGHDRVEVVHEALLAAWPRLVGWQREDAEGARLGEQLRAAARQWDGRGRPAGLLWRGDALAELRLWARRFPGRLAGAELDFAAASRAAEARAFRTRVALVTLAFAALVAGIVVLLRVNAEVQAQRRRAGDLAGDLEKGLVRQYLDQGRRALLADDPQLALAYLAEAHRRGADSPALRFLAAQAVRATDGELHVLPHGDVVWSARFSPDGRRLLTASSDGFARVWDAAGGVVLAVLPHAGGVDTAIFSPDGARVATGGRDGKLAVWDAASGRRLWSAPVEVSTLDFAPDGASLAVAAGDGTVQVRDVVTGALVRTLAAGSGGVYAIRYSDDGARLVTAGGDGRARVWVAASGAPLLTLDPKAGPIFSVAVGRGGHVATAGSDRAARVWDAAGRLVATLPHERSVTSVAFDPTGTRLATGSRDTMARIWEVPWWRLLTRIGGHRGSVNRARFSPDGKQLATASDDNTAAVWDAASGRPIFRPHGHAAMVVDVGWSPGGDRIATASFDGTAALWAVTPSLEVRVLPHPRGVNWARFDAAGGRFVTTCNDGITRVWNAATTSVEAELVDDARPTAAAFSPDGSLLAAALVDGRTELWDLGARRRIGTTAAHEGQASDAAFSPDGKLLATAGGGDGAVRLWTVPALAPQGVLDVGGILNSVTFHPTGATLLALGQKEPTVWDVAARTRLATWPEASHIAVGVFMPGGRLVVGAGANNGVRVVGYPDGNLVTEWYGHLGEVSSAWEHDGLVLTASLDETARIWDVRNGDLLAVLAGHSGPLRSAEMSRDGRHVLTAAVDGALMWTLPDPVPLERLSAIAACRTPYRFEGDTIGRTRRDRCP